MWNEWWCFRKVLFESAKVSKGTQLATFFPTSLKDMPCVNLEGLIDPPSFSTWDLFYIVFLPFYGVEGIETISHTYECFFLFLLGAPSFEGIWSVNGHEDFNVHMDWRWSNGSKCGFIYTNYSLTFCYNQPCYSTFYSQPHLHHVGLHMILQLFKPWE